MDEKENPINVALPNTSKQKMEAIVATAHAIENISKALISAQVDITISNNQISSAETAISIEPERDEV